MRTSKRKHLKLHSHKHTHKSGFTLTEAAITLAIAGIIVGAIWWAAAAVSYAQKISRMQGQIQSIAYNIRTLYANKAGFTGLLPRDATANLVGASVFPPDMIQAGAPVTPWGTPLIVIIQDAQSFWVRATTNLPTNVCGRILAGQVGAGAMQAPVAVWREDGTINTANINGATIFNAGQAVNFCADNAGGPSTGFGMQFLLK